MSKHTIAPEAIESRTAQSYREKICDFCGTRKGLLYVCPYCGAIETDRIRRMLDEED